MEVGAISCSSSYFNQISMLNKLSQTMEITGAEKFIISGKSDVYGEKSGITNDEVDSYRKNVFEKLKSQSQATQDRIQKKNSVSLIPPENEVRKEDCKTIGLTSFEISSTMSQCVLASFVKTSDPDDPVVQIAYGNGADRKVYHVHVNDVNTKNASDMEMFALLSYEGYQGRTAPNAINNYSAYKTMKANAGLGISTTSEDSFVNEKFNAEEILQSVYEWLKEGVSEEMKKTAVTCDYLLQLMKERSENSDASKSVTSGNINPKDSSHFFTEAMKEYKDSHQITAKELKEEKDWRDMSDEEWNDMVEGVDQYVEAYKERQEQLRELEKEAEQKAALEADFNMRTIAASSAALNVAANGFVNDENSQDGSESIMPTEDVVDHEKNWTKKLKTDDQAILGTAKEAQKMEKRAMSRLQEAQLVNDTTVGVSKEGSVTECASVEENNEKEKIWTITTFTEQGIISNRCQGGVIIEHWELGYTNPNDYDKINEFISRFNANNELNFAGDKHFWEEFLKGNITKEDLIEENGVWSRKIA